MKIGKYEISDWVKTDTYDARYIYNFTGDNCGGIFILPDVFTIQDVYFIDTSTNFISYSYVSIYHRSILSKDFEKIEDAKQHVDNFLNILQWLKAFL